MFRNGIKNLSESLCLANRLGSASTNNSIAGGKCVDFFSSPGITYKANIQTRFPVDDSHNFEPPADDEALLDARPPRRRVLGIKITTHNVAYPSFFQKLGPRIYEVEPGSTAAVIGIKADDMLLELDGNSVESITGAGQDQASAVLQYLSDNSRHSIILTIKRADQTELIKLVVPAE